MIADAGMRLGEELMNVGSPRQTTTTLFGTVTKDNGDGTLNLDVEGGTLLKVPMTTACKGVAEGDRVVVTTYGRLSVVTGVIAHDNSYYVSLVPYLVSGWKPYDTDESDSDYPHIVKIGNVCQVSGAVAPTGTMDSSSQPVTFAQLPEKFRPIKRFIGRMQGSSLNTWLLDVLPSGDMTAARYGITSYTDATSSNWLVFTATYLVH